ncbi:class I adenylate-forming enzyme family protein [Seohaeicola nanhaiensis]|uniref:Class I adenylate-forming enzyme family protein n=1 Tax=Seohaeicola nanhaiensis TaxID=1387282 RepID=A0ABV9KH47_9RHOB
MMDAEMTWAAGRASVFDLFRATVRRQPETVAIRAANGPVTYRDLERRVLALAAGLKARGLIAGQRVALLSENRQEYAELQLAAAALGLIVACQNWRLETAELRHCINLVEPTLVICSARFRSAYEATGCSFAVIEIESGWSDLLGGPALDDWPAIDPESGLIILYTSGTTGLPKGALISHRAEIARMCAYRMDLSVAPRDSFIAWAPMFHMGSTDQVLATLMMGGTVHILDGYDARAIVDIMARDHLGWLLLMPGTIEPVVEILRSEGTQVKGIRAIGAMIDLVPRDLAADLARLSGAGYLNSFGSTETGLPPGSVRLMGPDELLHGALSKRLSTLVDAVLVDSKGNEVPDETPGEMAVRGPTIFSGYWNAPETNAKDFRGGRFHMGDMFVRHADGTFDFVDRAKYMIKSGGENIYPAEIERVLLADPRVRDAVVVRRADARWGEVPVAFVARKGEEIDAAGVEALCRAELAGYKRPKEVIFVEYDDLPRSTTGKILRHELEARLRDVG